jgi:hypothetical protein
MMVQRRSRLNIVMMRLMTIGSLFAYFSSRGKFIMLPLLVFLLLSGLLLLVTGGLSYVAPFVYAVF